MDRRSFTPLDTVAYVWTTLDLPQDALLSIDLPENAECYPSSFKISHLAQASIGLSALTAALVWSVRNNSLIPTVTVPAEHACVEFKSERLYTLNGIAAPSSFGNIGGLHKTRDGYIRMHDAFPNHRKASLKILGLKDDATREDVAQKMQHWNSIHLEAEAIKAGAVMAALRSSTDWDSHPQSKAVGDFPILLNKITTGKPSLLKVASTKHETQCLQDFRVVEMSRVIAAPVAGKTLAVHGAVSDHSTETERS